MNFAHSTTLFLYLKESEAAFSRMLDSEALDGAPLLVVCNKCDQEVTSTRGLLHSKKAPAGSTLSAANQRRLRECYAEDRTTRLSCYKNVGVGWVQHFAYFYDDILSVQHEHSRKHRMDLRACGAQRHEKTAQRSILINVVIEQL